MYAIQTIFSTIFEAITNFYYSPVFAIIKIIIGIYVAIVFVDIVLLIIQRGVGANWRQMRYGIDMPKEFVTKKKKIRIRWQNILKRLDSGNEAEYKIAIIEADDVIDDLLKRIGYKGSNMGERIANIPAGQLEVSTMIKEAHEIRNRIIHEENFAVDGNFAREVLEKYEKLLRHFEALD